MEIIQNKGWILKIDLNGGRIRELKYKEEGVLGTFTRIDGKEGNTHICCPNFGPEGMEKFGLPFHGPFRNLEWKLINKCKDSIKIEVESLNFKIRQIFKLTDSFEQIVVVKNLSDKDRLVNMAIHNYWDTKNGWKGIRLNGEMVDDLIKSDSSKILPNINILEIPGKFKYEWSLNGFKYGRFWTAFKNSDSNKEYDQNYVCVEPSLENQGFLDGEKNNLLSLESLEFWQKIEILK